MIDGNREASCMAQHGENLLTLLIREGFAPDAPCGGNGTCGKCRVKLSPPPAASPKQTHSLSPEQVKEGVRLACQCQVEENCTITLHPHANALISTEGIFRDVPLNPHVWQRFVCLSHPTIEDQRSLERRLCEALETSVPLSAAMLSLLEKCVRVQENVLVTLWEDEIIDIAPGDTVPSSYGIAVDIGTTTVCAYLYNLARGTSIGLTSALNAQRSFGADVISRIDYTLKHADGLDQLHQLICTQVSHMSAELCSRFKIDPKDVHMITLAGNTTMMHLLAGISPKGIAASPFIPVFTQSRILPAQDIGIFINPHCRAYLLGSISAYVGADTVAAMVSCSMDKRKKALLIDIGTNGEIVLNTGDRLISCSTAAGPAFEGAHIRCGVGGVEGAISSVKWTNAGLQFATIGKKDPIGICGSGIVSLLALLLELGVVDETGRMVDADELEAEAVQQRLVEIDGQNAFVLNENIVFTAKDVREVQLAKAAIAAGVQTLLDEAGMDVAALDVIYLAGGFGSYVDRESACKIGLLPEAGKDKIIVCGNAAGSGAATVLCSKEAGQYAAGLQQSCQYIELSSSASFQQHYMDCMIF